jgi:hypothetical protein
MYTRIEEEEISKKKSLTRKMRLGLMTGMHVVIKTLLMQNLSYTHYVRSLHIIQNP